MMDKNIIPDKKTTKIFEEKKKKKKKLQKKKKKKKKMKIRRWKRHPAKPILKFPLFHTFIFFNQRRATDFSSDNVHR